MKITKSAEEVRKQERVRLSDDTEGVVISIARTGAWLRFILQQSSRRAESIRLHHSEKVEVLP